MCDHSLPRHRSYFHLKDPGSAITHFFGLVCAVPAMPALMIHGAGKGYDTPAMAALAVFLLSVIGLYAASTAYHAFDLEHGRNRILKKLDHIMIFFLIAGTYTPICAISLAGEGGRSLLLGVWAVALAGLVLKLCWVYHPKWLSSVLYIGMGWLCLIKLPDLLALLPRAGSCGCWPAVYSIPWAAWCTHSNWKNSTRCIPGSAPMRYSTSSCWAAPPAST